MSTEYLVPGVSNDDKANIVAYRLAKKRLSNISSYRYNKDVTADTDKFVMFTVGRNARRANKLILNAMVKDILVEADVFLLKDNVQSWEIITQDAKETSDKIAQWANYLGIKDNCYIITDHNTRAHNSLIKVNLYHRENRPLLEMNSIFYGKNGKAVKSMEDRIAAVYHLGYLMHKRRNSGIVRPNSACRQDIDFTFKMIDFVHKNGGPITPGGLRSDIRNTLRRFCSNYMWPGKEQLEERLKPQFPRPK
jgi:hypothetical protein